MGRDVGTAVADCGGVAMKPATSWEVLYNQLVKVGDMRLVYGWVGLCRVASENLLPLHLILIQGWFQKTVVWANAAYG